MPWRVCWWGDAWDQDFRRLDESDREAIRDEVAGWVETGPPGDPVNRVLSCGGPEVFEHLTPTLHVVLYRVVQGKDGISYVVVMRVRPARS